MPNVGVFIKKKTGDGEGKKRKIQFLPEIRDVGQTQQRAGESGVGSRVGA